MQKCDWSAPFQVPREESAMWELPQVIHQTMHIHLLLVIGMVGGWSSSTRTAYHFFQNYSELSTMNDASSLLSFRWEIFVERKAGGVKEWKVFNENMYALQQGFLWPSTLRQRQCRIHQDLKLYFCPLYIAMISYMFSLCLSSRKTSVSLLSFKVKIIRMGEEISHGKAGRSGVT